MSDRDELTEFLFEHIADPDGPGSDLSYTLREDDVWLAVNGNLDVQNLASDLLHGGYRKPRTIATADELLALPEDSVVMDAEGDVSQKRGGLWCGYETAPLNGNRLARLFAPFTVLYEPEAASE